MWRPAATWGAAERILAGGKVADGKTGRTVMLRLRNRLSGGAEVRASVALEKLEQARDGQRIVGRDAG